MENLYLKFCLFVALLAPNFALGNGDPNPHHTWFTSHSKMKSLLPLESVFPSPYQQIGALGHLDHRDRALRAMEERVNAIKKELETRVRVLENMAWDKIPPSDADREALRSIFTRLQMMDQIAAHHAMLAAHDNAAIKKAVHTCQGVNPCLPLNQDFAPYWFWNRALHRIQYLQEWASTLEHMCIDMLNTCIHTYESTGACDVPNLSQPLPASSGLSPQIAP